jgi:TolB protein
VKALHRRRLAFPISLCAIAAIFSFAPLSCGSDTEPQGQLAFSRGVDDDIVVMHPSGRGVRRLTFTHGGQFDPSWSPDGKELVFRDSRAGLNNNDEIYLINSDGSGLRNLTRNAANDWSPAWSPDGKTIAFASERSGTLALWTIKPDGSALQRLTRGVDEYPAWSPDSRWMAFGRDLPLADIWVVSSDGSRSRQLTHEADPEWLPGWSPDGSTIAYTRGFERHGTIWVMAMDGSQQRQLTEGHNDMAPAWSPDGRWLVFSRDGVLTVMDGHGKNLRSLGVRGTLPDWAPLPGAQR